MTRVRSSGFGLLEAIVALTLISATGLALFSWVNTNLAQANRLRSRDAAGRLQMAAVEFLGAINPAQDPHGQRDLGNIHLTWDASPQGAEAPGMNFIGTPSDYRMQLFDTTVNARGAGDEIQTSFHVMLLGYRKIDHALPAK